MTDIARALHNKRIVFWYNTLSSNAYDTGVTKHTIVKEYAERLQCPECEVCIEMSAPEEITFIYEKHRKEIDSL
jgi:hypothetical protein